MEKEEKFTFRQRWFPSMDEADDLKDERYEKTDSRYESGFPVIDFFGRWLRTIAVISMLGWGGCQAVGNNIKYSEGVRSGMINKISEKGLFWKTYEGQLALEGVASQGNQIGANVWDFSIDRQARHGENPQELANKLRQYLESGTKVKITYTEPLSTWPWRSGTDYLVQDVQPLEVQRQTKVNN